MKMSLCINRICVGGYILAAYFFDEFKRYRSICAKNFPCLRNSLHPPFEDTWKHFYAARKSCFAVIGGPISQAACMDGITSAISAGAGNTIYFFVDSPYIFATNLEQLDYRMLMVFLHRRGFPHLKNYRSIHYYPFLSCSFHSPGGLSLIIMYVLCCSCLQLQLFRVLGWGSNG